MSKNVGAKTKGLIKNNRTGVVREFMFNPSEFQYSRGVTYATIDAPGIYYPDSQFVKGNIREFNISLFVYDKPYTGQFEQCCNFYGGFLTNEVVKLGDTKPPEMTFVFGSWARTCVMTNLDIKVDEFNTELHPVRFTLSMTLRQVGV